jgi:serine/threonine protein kinase
LNGYKTCLSEKFIHRNIKPANLLVANGVFKLSDFGMGRIIEDMGTPSYAAP